MPATSSTADINKTLRARLLTFVPPAPFATLNVTLGGRLWIGAAPDEAPYPYGVLRLINQITGQDGNTDRETADLELFIYGRPLSQAQTVEAAADVADQALLRYRDSTSGLMFGRERLRDTLPMFADPADREVVGVRLLYSLVIWPVFLTQHSAA